MGFDQSIFYSKFHKSITFCTYVLISGLCFFSNTAQGQCAMCRAALGGESNKAQAEAVNDGIVFLMVVPYLLVAGVAYAIYRMRKNKN